MPSPPCRRHPIRVDDEGFLTNVLDWTPEIAEEIAHRAGIAILTADHWKVIAACREDAARRGVPPELPRIVDLTGLDTKALHALFPREPVRLAVQIAGLRKPGA